MESFKELATCGVTFFDEGAAFQINALMNIKEGVTKLSNQLKQVTKEKENLQSIITQLRAEKETLEKLLKTKYMDDRPPIAMSNCVIVTDKFAKGVSTMTSGDDPRRIDIQNDMVQELIKQARQAQQTQRSEEETPPHTNDNESFGSSTQMTYIETHPERTQEKAMDHHTIQVSRKQRKSRLSAPSLTVQQPLTFPPRRSSDAFERPSMATSTLVTRSETTSLANECNANVTIPPSEPTSSRCQFPPTSGEGGEVPALLEGEITCLKTEEENYEDTNCDIRICLDEKVDHGPTEFHTPVVEPSYFQDEPMHNTMGDSQVMMDNHPSIEHILPKDHVHTVMQPSIATDESWSRDTDFVERTNRFTTNSTQLRPPDGGTHGLIQTQGASTTVDPLRHRMAMNTMVPPSGTMTRGTGSFMSSVPSERPIASASTSTQPGTSGMQDASPSKENVKTDMAITVSVKGRLEASPSMDEESRPYKCDTCEKSFSRKATLAEHLRTHTGERPFRCAICEMRFTARGNLIRHKRVHSGEKPYLCSICSKRFARLVTLRKHLLCHGDKGAVSWVPRKKAKARQVASQTLNQKPSMVGRNPATLSWDRSKQ